MRQVIQVIPEFVAAALLVQSVWANEPGAGPQVDALCQVVLAEVGTTVDQNAHTSSIDATIKKLGPPKEIDRKMFSGRYNPTKSDESVVLTYPKGTIHFVRYLSNSQTPPEVGLTHIDVLEPGWLSSVTPYFGLSAREVFKKLGADELGDLNNRNATLQYRCDRPFGELYFKLSGGSVTKILFGFGEYGS